MPVYTQKYDFGAICDFLGGGENGPRNPNNISKIGQTASREVEGERPGADLGAIWRRAENAPRSYFHRSGIVFWIDFGRILDKSRLILDVVFHDFDVILTYIL